MNKIKIVSVVNEKDWRGVEDYLEGNGSREVFKMVNVENGVEVCSYFYKLFFYGLKVWSYRYLVSNVVGWLEKWN